VLNKEAGPRRFVGREAELHLIGDLLARAQNGHGGAAIIGGDAGLGKSRLCREIKANAAHAGMRVIEGRCSPAESTIPYAPFVDALRFRLAKGEAATVTDVLQPILAHVAPLFQELSQADQAVGRTAEPTAAPYERIFGVFKRFTAHGPVLFILEDLHWADPTSRDLIHFITHHIHSLPMMMLLTYRTDEIPAGHPVHRMVSAVSREPDVARLQLAPLTQKEVALLVADMFGEEPATEVTQAIARRTEGNPLFVEELVHMLFEMRPEHWPHYSAEDVAEVTIPTTVSEMVQERLTPLSDDARDALLVASVIGRRFSFDLLCSVIEWPEARLLGAIEELVAHGFLTEIGGAEEVFAFRHSLVQEVIYGSAIGRRRRVWHRRVATVLEQSARATALPHATLAHHYQLGGESTQARMHLVLSGDEAARLCAWKDAEAMYEQALSMAEEQNADAETQVVILERLSEVAWWQNRVSAVEQYAGEALAVCRALGDRARAARLLRRLANLDAYQGGDFRKAFTRLQEALQLVEGDAGDAAVILNDVGRLQFMRGEWSQAASSFERVLPLTIQRGDCAEEAFALVNLGRIAVGAGNVMTGVHRLELARALVAEDQMHIERAAEVYHAGIRVLDAAREHPRAREWLAAAVEFAETHKMPGDLAIYQAYGASIQRRAGDWKTAMQQAAHAVSELRRMARAELREALRIHGDMHRVLGNLSSALTAYEEASALGDVEAEIGKALVHVAEQQWERAAVILEAQLAAAPAENKLFAMRVLPILIEVRANRGQVQAAQSALARLEALTVDSDYRAGTAATAYARAVVLSAQAETEAAANESARALEAWQKLQLPYEAARAALLVARLTSDEQYAREAARVFDELQARLDLAHAESVLRQLGARRRVRRTVPDLPPPLDRLTAREVEVLGELARGRTNKQIAKTLAMSPKTVGNHVSAIFMKLGCATRTEAAQLSAPLLKGKGAA
jgi:DNA-binding NarL/FixJ family response regulator/tetratricopeptide (TPR) repeat protein